MMSIPIDSYLQIILHVVPSFLFTYSLIDNNNEDGILTKDTNKWL